jgi:hypothetical protein
MKYQIADAKTRYFKNKQHYLNFLDAWKKEASSDNCRLTGAHMLFYALLRGKDARSAFKPITRKSKLENGAIINHGMYWAYQDLAWQNRSPDKFLEPFDGTIDTETFLKFIDEMPKIPAIYSNYGKGRLAAEAMMDNRRQPEELWAIIDEVME